MLSNPQSENAFFRFFKKLIDLLFSISVLALLGWLMILVWGLVRLGSPGPGIFAQQRVGQHGRVFTCYKFRTMRLGTQQAGTHEISSDVITGVGAILRKTKIDELPQIWNILRGEMSLVGPRPCLPIQTQLCSLRSQHGVLDVLPGITGLAQIRGIDMSNAENLVRVDHQYTVQRSLILDCKIIIATILGSGRGDRVRS